MGRDPIRNLQWNKGGRLATSNKIGAPDNRTGGDGDVQIRQTALGARLFGKIGGRWYNTPLTADDKVRFGTAQADQLVISNDAVSIFKDNAKVASFSDDTIIGEVGASKSNVQITSGAINLRTNTTTKLSLDTSGNITTKGIVKIETAASDGNLGLLLDNDGGGYNQQIFRGANPEIHMGYSGSGGSLSGNDTTTPGAEDVLGSSKIFMNRSADGGLSTIVFATAGTTNFALGGADSKFSIVAGGDIRDSQSPRLFYSNSSRQIFLPGVYDDNIGTERDLLIQSDGQIGYDGSSKAFKTNIKSMEDVSWLNQLNPVTFDFRKKDDDGGILDEANLEKGTQHGLIAEEVWAIQPDLCHKATIEEKERLNLETDAISVKYKNIVPALIKAVQELSAKLDTMQTEINNLKSE